MSDINIQRATVGRWRRSTKWSWAFLAGLAAVLAWGALEMVQSARSVEHEVGSPPTATGEVAQRQEQAEQASAPAASPETQRNE
jgi:hypothetical protein